MDVVARWDVMIGDQVAKLSFSVVTCSSTGSFGVWGAERRLTNDTSKTTPACRKTTPYLQDQIYVSNSCEEAQETQSIMLLSKSHDCATSIKATLCRHGWEQLPRHLTVIIWPCPTRAGGETMQYEVHSA
jgi:sorbitol-specific phosphotransferase system component IIBC